MKINYTFNNGENLEVEVSEEIGAVILESRKKEENMERNRRRRCYSLDCMDFEGEVLLMKEHLRAFLWSRLIMSIFLKRLISCRRHRNADF